MTLKDESNGWSRVPSIDGSRWGFIALIIAIAVVLLLLICIIVCLCRKNRNKASKGDSLMTSHPAPVTATKRPPEPIIKPTPAPKPPQAQYMLDEEEGGSIYDHRNGRSPYAAAMAADKRNGSQQQMHQVNPGDYGYHTPVHGQQQYQQQPYDGYDYQSQYAHDQQPYGAVPTAASVAHSNSQYGYDGARAGAGRYGYDNQYLPPGAAQPQYPDNSRFHSPTPTSPMGAASPGGYAMPTPFAPAQQSSHPGTYPQDNYAASSSQPAAAASPHVGYEEGYSPYAAEEPPAYPQEEGALHTHDEAKTSFGPRAT